MHMTASQLVEAILVAAGNEDPVIRLAVEDPDGAVLVDDWAIAWLTAGRPYDHSYSDGTSERSLLLEATIRHGKARSSRVA